MSNKTAGLNATLDGLKQALAKDSYDKFLYWLFFKDCKMMPLPAGFSPVIYPTDGSNATITDVKEKVIEALKKGKPVLFTGFCIIPGISHECKEGHSLVISGYKQVVHPKDKK